MPEPKRTQLANKAVEIASAADKIARRTIDDLPHDLLRTQGAKEVAILTLAARAHELEFKPVMDALQVLSKVTDWKLPFLVANDMSKRPYFDWRDAPVRYYESFKDFYARELEATWGRWEDLQHTWGKIVAGEITEEEGTKIILGSHGGARAGAGRPRKGESRERNNQGGKNENVTTLKSNEKNTKAHILARLDQDRPDLAARVRAKTMSANEAAIELGWRKPRSRKKLSALERIIKLLPKLTKVERKDLKRRLDQEDAPPSRTRRKPERQKSLL